MICPGCYTLNPIDNRFCQRCFRLLAITTVPVDRIRTVDQESLKRRRWKFWR